MKEQLNSEIRRAETATKRVHRWRIVERPLDIEVSCEISGSFPTNKQSRTNSGLSTSRGVHPMGGANEAGIFIIAILGGKEIFFST